MNAHAGTTPCNLNGSAASNDTRNHHLWTPLTNKPLSKESSEAFNSSGEGPDDFKKMVSYLKSWKEKKERNELTQDDEKRSGERDWRFGTIDGWRNGRGDCERTIFW